MLASSTYLLISALLFFNIYNASAATSKKNPFLLKSNHSKVHASQSVISGDQNLIPTQWFYFGSGDAITFCQTCPDDTLYMTEIDNVQQNQMSYIAYNHSVNPSLLILFFKIK